MLGTFYRQILIQRTKLQETTITSQKTGSRRPVLSIDKPDFPHQPPIFEIFLDSK